MTPSIRETVERLRALSDEHFEMLGDIHKPLTEAADTIERLAGALHELTEHVDADILDVNDRLEDLIANARQALSGEPT